MFPSLLTDDGSGRDVSRQPGFGPFEQHGQLVRCRRPPVRHTYDDDEVDTPGAVAARLSKTLSNPALDRVAGDGVAESLPDPNAEPIYAETVLVGIDDEPLASHAATPGKNAREVTLKLEAVCG